MYFCTPLVYIIAMCKYLRIRLFVIFTILTISGFSQPLHTFPHTPKTSLTVASDRYAFWLFIDEAIQNEAPTMSLMVQDIPEGQHYMRVEIDNSVHSTFGQLIQLQYSNNAYWIENQRNMFGISAISNPPRPETIVVFSSMQQNQTYPNAPGHQPQHPRPPHNPQPPFGHPCMNDADFNAALSIIQNETFESSKSLKYASFLPLKKTNWTLPRVHITTALKKRNISSCAMFSSLTAAKKSLINTYNNNNLCK